MPRQQTLAAAIDWSHDLLTEDERRLFQRMSVFAGGWAVEAAEAVCSPDHGADNLRAALIWGSEHEPSAALRMAVDLSWYWWYRRRYPEGVGWHERLLDRASEDAQLQARALAHIALLARGYGDLDRARIAVSDASARVDALGDRRGKAHVLWTLTFLYLGEDRVSDAWSAAREYLRLNQEPGDLARQVFAFAQLGLVATFDEDLVAARTFFEQALRLARPLDDRFNIVRLCYMLGTVRRLAGRSRGGGGVVCRGDATD
jgi:hypothetical protein